MSEVEVTASEEDKRILAATIQNENTIINQRMGWALQLQGFLFAAFFISNPTRFEQAGVALAALGFLTSVSSLIGSFYGNLALVNSIKAFEEIQAKEGDRRIRAGHRFRFAPVFLMPHLFIPFALAGVWAFLFSRVV